MSIEHGIDRDASTYDEVLARYRPVIPGRLNIARVVCDGQPPDALALVDAGRSQRFTFGELTRLSARLARVLADHGVGRGDRVAVFAGQGLANALTHVASFRLGAVSVPLSPLFRTDALAYRLRASGSKVVVTEPELAPFLHDVDLGSIAILAGDDLWARVDAAGEVEPTIADTSADDPAMLIYTSGTSGPPKGVLHGHRFVPARLGPFELLQGFSQAPAGRPFWTPADWAWIAGLVDCVLTPWAFGRPILALPRRGAFDPAAAVAAAREHGVGGCFLPPTALGRLREAFPAGCDLPDVTVHSAGEPLRAELYGWARRSFGRVYELYGMTEVGAVVGSHALVPHRPGSMGRPLPGHRVALLDAEGVAVEGEGEGEIAVGREDAGLMLEYFGDPEGTAARMRGAWFTTGDVARRDADGYLWYLGRTDDVFNTSGYRVGPTEIEQTLGEHAAVLQAAVVGLPDAARGTVIAAFVVLRPGHAPGEALAAALQDHVRQQLAAYQYPRKIVFARELPTTVTGKVIRARLREPDAEARYAR